MTKHVSPGIRVSSLVHSEHVRNLDWFLNSGHVAFSLQLFLDYLSFVKVSCPLKPRGCRCKGNLLFLLVLDLLSRRVIEMASGGDSALEEAITKLFEAPKNGTKLMGALVALLVTYMVLSASCTCATVGVACKGHSGSGSRCGASTTHNPD